MLLSTFGLALRGILNGKSQFPDFQCPPRTNGIYPNYDYLPSSPPSTYGTCEEGNQNRSIVCDLLCCVIFFATLCSFSFHFISFHRIK